MKIKIVIIDKIINSRMLLVAWLVCLSTWSYAASDCMQSHASIKQNLLEFKEELLVVNSSKSFQDLLHGRYDTISFMLEVLERCDHAAIKANPEISIIMDVLREIRADARQLAFSEYSNWLSVKNDEINLFQKMDEIITEKK